MMTWRALSISPWEEDAASVEWIERYAADQDLFFKDFTQAYLKMTEQGATWAA
jgi:L-ascorbate peroxidase